VLNGCWNPTHVPNAITNGASASNRRCKWQAEAILNFFIKHLFVEKREKYLKNLNCRDC
jgi:hypothetical protein